MADTQRGGILASRSPTHGVAIILIGLGLQGCAAAMPPQVFGLDELSNAFPVGASGRALDKELVSRGFKISDYMAQPHHDAYFQFEGLVVTCLARVQWDEDRLGKVSSNLTIIYPCAGL